MPSPQVGIRFEKEIYEEILRLAKSHKKSTAEIVRLLVRDALAQRAEELTASQFQMVENRLAYLEKRFSAFLVKTARAAAEGLFYSEQIVLSEASEKERLLLKEAAQKYSREFLKAKSSYNEEQKIIDSSQEQK